MEQRYLSLRCNDGNVLQRRNILPTLPPRLQQQALCELDSQADKHTDGYLAYVFRSRLHSAEAAEQQVMSISTPFQLEFAKRAITAGYVPQPRTAMCCPRGKQNA